MGTGAEICKLPQERGAVPVRRVPVCINCHHKIHGADTLQATAGHGIRDDARRSNTGYATMFRRIRDLSVQAMGSIVAVTARDGTRHMFYAVDTTGIKVANRRKWINKKWKVRRGFIKMHALADTDTGLILALKITDGFVGIPRRLSPC